MASELPIVEMAPDNLASNIAEMSVAQHALAAATTVHETKTIRDKAEAVRKYAQAANMGLECQNYASEIKLRAERRAGQLLVELNLRGGDRRSKSHDATLKLDHLGITKSQSARWQLESSVPDELFDEYVRSTMEEGKELSSAGLLRLARSLKRTCDASSFEDDARPLVGLTGDLDVDAVITEINYHCESLARVLEPYCRADGTELPLRVVEQRTVYRYLREMQVGLQRLATLMEGAK